MIIFLCCDFRFCSYSSFFHPSIHSVFLIPLSPSESVTPKSFLTDCLSVDLLSSASDGRNFTNHLLSKISLLNLDSDSPIHPVHKGSRVGFGKTKGDENEVKGICGDDDDENEWKHE